MAATTLTFCQDYVKAAGSVIDLAYWFLFAALALGILYALVELYKRFTGSTQPPVKVAQTALKDLIDALKGLVEALATAPAWIALFAIGLVLFWAAGEAIPTKCEPAMIEPYAVTKAGANGAGNAPNPGGSGSNTVYDEDGRPRYHEDGRPDPNAAQDRASGNKATDRK